jgi:hypothetical protein
MPKKIFYSAEMTALDQVSPATHRARDATHFRRIVAARKKIEEQQDELRSAVDAARAAGDSWTIIGAALNTTRQAAYQRYGRSRSRSELKTEPGRVTHSGAKESA